MDIEPDPAKSNSDDGEYFESDQVSPPENNKNDIALEPVHMIELSSDDEDEDEDEEEETRYDASGFWRSTPRDERVLIPINIEQSRQVKHRKSKTATENREPLPPSPPPRGPFKGWTVETLDGKHYIPCPECHEKVEIVGRLSLKKHIHSSHPGAWSRLTSQQCQLCSPSTGKQVYPSDVINHMSQKHRINFRGPMHHPAWVPTDLSAKTFICPECRSLVPTMELKSHMQFYTLSSGSQMAFPCSLCPKTNRKVRVHVEDFTEHLKSVHGILDDNSEREKTLKTQKQSQIRSDRVQCTGCPNQVKKVNLQKHLKKCQGRFQFCRGCNKNILMQDMAAHSNCFKSAALTLPATSASCGKLTPLSFSDPQVPELTDDIACSTPGALSLPRKVGQKAVQINLLNKRDSPFNQKSSKYTEKGTDAEKDVDSDSRPLEKKIKIQ